MINEYIQSTHPANTIEFFMSFLVVRHGIYRKSIKVSWLVAAIQTGIRSGGRLRRCATTPTLSLSLSLSNDERALPFRSQICKHRCDGMMCMVYDSGIVCFVSTIYNVTSIYICTTRKNPKIPLFCLGVGICFVTSSNSDNVSMFDKSISI